MNVISITRAADRAQCLQYISYFGPKPYYKEIVKVKNQEERIKSLQKEYKKRDTTSNIIAFV